MISVSILIDYWILILDNLDYLVRNNTNISTNFNTLYYYYYLYVLQI